MKNVLNIAAKIACGLVLFACAAFIAIMVVRIFTYFFISVLLLFVGFLFG